MAAAASAREQAIAALVHRLNGGLHNAALALELAAEGGGNPGLLQSGLAGVELASRAAALLDALARTRVRDEAAASYAGDVVELLSLHAARRSIELRGRDPNAPAPAMTPQAAAQALVDGLAVIASAAPNAPLQLEMRTSADAPALRVIPAGD